MFQKIKFRIKTEGIPWIRHHWLFLTVSAILAFSQPLILGIIFLYGLVATIEVEMLKAMIQAEATILGFYGLIVVYALTSLDDRIDTLEEQIFEVEEKYLDLPDNPESIRNIGKTKIAKRNERLNKIKKTRGKTVFSALYVGILLIGSLLASILGLGFFIYLFKNKLKIVHVPLFEPKRLSEPYTPPTIELPKPKGLWQRMKEFFFGTSKYRKTGEQNEAMRVLWQRDKQRRI